MPVEGTETMVKLLKDQWPTVQGTSNGDSLSDALWARGSTVVQ